MELSHWNKKEQAPLVAFLGVSLLAHPLMMYQLAEEKVLPSFR